MCSYKTCRAAVWRTHCRTAGEARGHAMDSSQGVLQLPPRWPEPADRRHELGLQAGLPGREKQKWSQSWRGLRREGFCLMGTHADAGAEARNEGKQDKDGQERKLPAQERHRPAEAMVEWTRGSGSRSSGVSLQSRNSPSLTCPSQGPLSPQLCWLRMNPTVFPRK